MLAPDQVTQPPMLMSSGPAFPELDDGERSGRQAPVVAVMPRMDDVSNEHLEPRIVSDDEHAVDFGKCRIEQRLQGGGRGVIHLRDETRHGFQFGRPGQKRRQRLPSPLGGRTQNALRQIEMIAYPLCNLARMSDAHRTEGARKVFGGW